MGALSPAKKFEDWDRDKAEKLTALMGHYSDDFNVDDASALKVELKSFPTDMKRHFKGSSLEDLSVYLVDTERVSHYPVLYRLIVLVLTLPVSTATGERAFSKMNLIKDFLRSSMGQDFLRALMMLGIEKSMAKQVSEDDVIERYLAMRSRRGANQM
jgi:hypothetical protein